jgi:hypothetical protein
MERSKKANGMLRYRLNNITVSFTNFIPSIATTVTILQFLTTFTVVTLVTLAMFG